MANLYKYQFGRSNYTQWGISNYEQWFAELIPLIITLAGYYVLEPVTYLFLLESIGFCKIINNIDYYKYLEDKYNA